MKRHKDAVLTIHSPKGFEGGLLVSGSADHSIRSKIYNLVKLVYNWYFSVGFIEKEDFK